MKKYSKTEIIKFKVFYSKRNNKTNFCTHFNHRHFQGGRVSLFFFFGEGLSSTSLGPTTTKNHRFYRTSGGLSPHSPPKYASDF